MYKDWAKLANDLGALMRDTRKAIPETWGGFSQMAKGATTPGALDTKTKELIAVGISIANRCDGCLAFHVRSAVEAGATREEMLETVAVGLYMGGGPSAVYGSMAMEAFDQAAAGK
ncbi:carboxymuconolactone decarboxylase family protein [Pararhodospirillum oryzae]|uniref:Alkyl hydroperoxide reductase AhpD n=1 Tax=Pararhodospirillum oryzae TaxID=478448 RepID=A0A512HB80_9PROT|nr:carboxymuconolactone decarboxylase family protein [Pararhodospirillum oryzae]GEO82699.1 alkyl hydroperoxide reductase AhpD [Pararhodospirillum oryzae]